MIDTLIDQRWEELAEAIVRQAMVDYRKAFRVSRKIAKKPEQRRRKAKADKEIKEINEFLHSGWFGVLTELDPDYLTLKVREDVRRRRWYMPEDWDD